MRIGLLEHCNKTIGCEKYEMEEEHFQEILKVAISFQLLGFFLIFCLLIINNFMIEWAQEWNFHLLIPASTLIFSLSIILEIIASSLFLASKKGQNDSNKKETERMKLRSRSTSFGFFLLTILFNQILVSLAFYTWSFIQIESNGLIEPTEKELKIKNRCTKQISVVDIRSAPKSTPTADFKSERSHRSKSRKY